MDERTLARFLSKVNQNGPVPLRHPELGPCWLWKPLGSTGGYGSFSLNGKPRLAHRVSYEHFTGPIPPGYDIDHQCDVRNCVRPDHLRARTRADNTRRARSWEGGAAFQRDKTHCAQGHPYSGPNLRIAKNGKRCCRECDRRYSSEHRERKAAASPPQPRPPKEFCAQGHPFAEFGVLRGGMRVCGECERERNRQYRERRRAEQEPKVKTTCKQGHPWAEDNIYVDPRGHRHCKACHNQRTLARYYAGKAERLPRPPREACGNGHPWNEENIYVLPDGTEKCRRCSRDRSRRYEAKRAAARTPKPPRTHCKYGHELAGDNLYTDPNGRKFCRQCTVMYQARKRAGLATPSPAKGRRRSHCPEGHEMTPENTYTSPGGDRKCRECLRRRTREHMRAKRAAAKRDTADPALTLF
jgi:hypothetical protein